MGVRREGGNSRPDLPADPRGSELGIQFAKNREACGRDFCGGDIDPATEVLIYQATRPPPPPVYAPRDPVQCVSTQVGTTIVTRCY